MERVVRVINMKDDHGDRGFWLTKTPAERIDAIEILREQYVRFKGDVQQGLQRVCRVIEQPRR
jgi:hypothetical protein